MLCRVCSFKRMRLNLSTKGGRWASLRYLIEMCSVKPNDCLLSKPIQRFANEDDGSAGGGEVGHGLSTQSGYMMDA